MTFKALCSKRSSVRNFRNKPITEAEWNYLLECTRLAPSAVNRQPWHFYILTSRQDCEKLWPCYDREWFKTAPAIVVCCARRQEAWVRPGDNKPHADIDIAIATEHFCLAAADLDLGTCWVCNFDAKLCHEILQLPSDEEPVVLVPIGHASEQHIEKPKSRKEQTEIATFL